jgi:DNA-binding transcriptional LysR family regulator
MPINELRAVGTFIKAAELGSLRKAADAQGLTPQAASHAVAQLEKHLGVRLFHRTTRSLSLTDEGQHFLEMAQPSLAGLQEALQVARRDRDRIEGRLRIAAPRSILRPILWRLLSEFVRRNPKVQPDVWLDDRIGNWVEDRVDIGFRIGVSPQDGVVARRLFPLQLIICAAPAYLRKHGVPRNLAGLASHRCSAFRQPATGRIVPWRVRVNDEDVEHFVKGTLFTNDEELELAAALSGDVIAQLTGIACAEHLRAGRLVPVLVQHASTPVSIFIYYGSRPAQPARVRAFIDLVVAQIKEFEGYVVGARDLAAMSRSAIKREHRSA